MKEEGMENSIPWNISTPVQFPVHNCWVGLVTFWRPKCAWSSFVVGMSQWCESETQKMKMKGHKSKWRGTTASLKVKQWKLRLRWGCYHIRHHQSIKKTCQNTGLPCIITLNLDNSWPLVKQLWYTVSHTHLLKIWAQKTLTQLLFEPEFKHWPSTQGGWVGDQL